MIMMGRISRNARWQFIAELHSRS